MKGTPFKYVRQSSLWKLAVHLGGSDVDRDFEFAVDGMEVRRCVIAVVHRDHDSKEAAYLGHVGSVARDIFLPPNGQG